MIASVLSRTIRRTCIPNASRQLASTCSGFRNKSIPKDASRRSCWKCGSKICQGCTLFCASPTCGAIQGLEKDGCNYFCLFGIEGTFDLDDAHLEATFKNLQKQLHPDKFAMKSIEERERSSYNSSIVNQAYQLLKSPVDRLNYLLSFHDIDILTEGKTFSDPTLMREIFELSERAEEATEQEEVLAFLEELDSDLEKISMKIQGHLDRRNYVAAGEAAVKLKYLINVQDGLKAKLN